MKKNTLKRTLSVVLSLLMVVGLFSSIPVSAASDDGIIYNDDTGIPDPVLYKALLIGCDENQDNVLQEEELLKLHEFYYDTSYGIGDIYSLKGMNKCKNLLTISICNTKIKSLDGIEGLKLISVCMHDNELEDISAIENTLSLIDLNVYKNNLTSLPNLKNLVNLSLRPNLGMYSITNFNYNKLSLDEIKNKLPDQLSEYFETWALYQDPIETTVPEPTATEPIETTVPEPTATEPIETTVPEPTATEPIETTVPEPTVTEPIETTVPEPTATEPIETTVPEPTATEPIETTVPEPTATEQVETTVPEPTATEPIETTVPVPTVTEQVETTVAPPETTVESATDKVEPTKSVATPDTPNNNSNSGSSSGSSSASINNSSIVATGDMLGASNLLLLSIIIMSATTGVSVILFRRKKEKVSNK